jgi:hypothetical protein
VTTANDFMTRFTNSLADLTPRQRVEKIDAWLPELRDPRKAQSAGVNAFEQHLVVVELMTIRENNVERITS